MPDRPMTAVKRARPFKLTAPKISEHQFQIDATKMLHMVLLPDVAWSAVDHGHSMNMTIGRHGRPIGLVEAQMRVARGVRRGLPDYLFWHRGKAFALELKILGGVLSKDQDAFLENMIAAGASVGVCFDLWQVFAKVKDWGLCRPGVVLQ